MRNARSLRNIFANKKIILLVFICLACIFYIDKILLGPYAFVRVHDTFDSEFSRCRAMGEILMKYGLTAWMPHMMAGMPSYATQLPPIHILSIIAVFVPLWPYILATKGDRHKRRAIK